MVLETAVFTLAAPHRRLLDLCVDIRPIFDPGELFSLKKDTECNGAQTRLAFATGMRSRPSRLATLMRALDPKATLRSAQRFWLPVQAKKSIKAPLCQAQYP